MVSTIFDANCWCERVDEEVGGQGGRATNAFSKAELLGQIVLDDEGHIKHQYCAARRGFGEKLFDLVFEAYALRGKVLIAPRNRDPALTRALRTVGVPNGEHAYFHAANTVGAEYLVSEDIDFFDPTLKRANAQAKARAKQRRNGCACRLARNMGCEVYCIDGYLAA